MSDFCDGQEDELPSQDAHPVRHERDQCGQREQRDVRVGDRLGNLGKIHVPQEKGQQQDHQDQQNAHA